MAQPTTLDDSLDRRHGRAVVLLLLKQKRQSYGYDLAGELDAQALTDAGIERAALYRTLRQLEAGGNVASGWQTEQGGSRRRVYRLTPRSERHLDEWVTVLGQVPAAMGRFIRKAKRVRSRPTPSGTNT